jgi:hypothetical protein
MWRVTIQVMTCTLPKRLLIAAKGILVQGTSGLSPRYGLVNGGMILSPENCILPVRCPSHIVIAFGILPNSVLILIYPYLEEVAIVSCFVGQGPNCHIQILGVILGCHEDIPETIWIAKLTTQVSDR